MVTDDCCERSTPAVMARAYFTSCTTESDACGERLPHRVCRLCLCLAIPDAIETRSNVLMVLMLLVSSIPLDL